MQLCLSALTKQTLLTQSPTVASVTCEIDKSGEGLNIKGGREREGVGSETEKLTTTNCNPWNSLELSYWTNGLLTKQFFAATGFAAD